MALLLTDLAASRVAEVARVASVDVGHDVPYPLLGHGADDLSGVVVEDAWNWEALRTTITITTSASTYNYAVTGAGDRARLLQIYDSTNRAFLEQRNKSFFTDQLQLMANPTQGKPAYYQFNGISAGGDIKVDLFPIPDNTYSVKLDLVVPTADLSSGTDSVSIPSKPIVLLAWAKAIEERGEDGGINVSSQYAVAKQSLLDYIAVEAARHPDETIWYSV